MIMAIPKNHSEKMRMMICKMEEQEFKEFVSFFCDRFGADTVSVTMMSISLAGHLHTTEKYAKTFIKKYAKKKGKDLIVEGEDGKTRRLIK